MSGEVDMELDDTTVHLKAGDVLVQRGTIQQLGHLWFAGFLPQASRSAPIPLP
jgi:hypothetical protein